MHYKAKEMLQKARQEKHGSHSSILARWNNDYEYISSLSLIGWTEQDTMLFDRIALETQCEGCVNASNWWNITFIFPIADGTPKLFGGDQVLGTSTSIRDRPERGEGQEILRGKSEGSPFHDSFSDAGEAMNDFWSMSGNFIYRHHVEPRVKLYVPREESFPIPIRYIYLTRATSSTLYVMLERRMDDCWKYRRRPRPITRFTLLDEKPPE